MRAAINADEVVLRVPVTHACWQDLTDQAQAHDLDSADLASLLLGIALNLLVDGDMTIESEGWAH
jgi:hypothetical protein